MFAVIHDRSPWVEISASPGSSTISRTGMVVPLTLACIARSPRLAPGSRAYDRAQSLPLRRVGCRLLPAEPRSTSARVPEGPGRYPCPVWSAVA